MRVAGAGSRWSLAQAALFALASSTILTYIAFDVLDIDGSNLKWLFTLGMTTVEAAQTETERLHEANVWSSSSPVHDRPPISNLLTAVSLPTDRGRPAVTLASYGMRPPRANLAQRMALNDPVPTEPA